MAPRQVFPYDEGGGSLRSSRNFLTDATCDPGLSQQQEAEVRWAGGEVEEDSTSFAPPLSEVAVGRRGVGREEARARGDSGDLHDALNDDDDDGDDASVDLGSNWSNREFVPKRGVEIFVGGLTRSTRRDMLRDWFQHAGEVTEVRIARDKRRRRCRGYGYVRFATSEQANRAIDTMHRFEFKHGRFLGVLPSDENRTLFVGGLREEWSCEYICQLLKEKMPGLQKVEPIPDREDRLKIRTFCFLEFASHAEAAVVFDRHHTSPRPPPQQQQQQLAGPVSGEMAETYSTGAGDAGSGGADMFFARESRLRSTSSCTTSCASIGVSECSRKDGCCAAAGDGLGSSATGATAPSSASPDLSGGSDGAAGGDARPSDGSGVWGQQLLDMEDNAGSGALFPWDDGKTEFDGGGAEEAQARAGGGVVPLVVGGATLKVDWADPLRYHIHLNGGIKGPSAPPEVGIPRGGDGGGGGDGGRGGASRMGVDSRGQFSFTTGSTWQRQQQQQQQQQRLDHSRGYPFPLSLPYTSGASRVAIRDRGYTVATGYVVSRRSPFEDYADDGGERSRAISSSQLQQSEVDDRVRANSSSLYHSSHHRHQQHRYPAVADQRDDYGDVNFIPLPPPSAHPHEQQTRLRPHPAHVGGDPSLSHHPHGHIGTAAASPTGFRTVRSSSVGGVSGGPRGRVAGQSPTGQQQQQHHHHHHHHHHHRGASAGSGGGGVGFAAGRPFSASPPDAPRRRTSYSAAISGNNGHGERGLPLQRSASCQPLPERQNFMGVSGGQRAAAAAARQSPSWDRRASREETAGIFRGSSSRAAVDWANSDLDHASAARLQGGEFGERQASIVPAQGGYLSRQRQQWEQHGVADPGLDNSKDRAPTSLDGITRGTSYHGHHGPDGFAPSFDHRIEEHQHAPAATQPPARRHTLAGVLDLGLGAIGGYGGGDPPPGFSANHAGGGGASDSLGRAVREQQQQQDEGFGADAPAGHHRLGGSGGGGWPSPPLLPRGEDGDGGTAEDWALTGMHLGAGLWETIGTGGLDCRDRSSWPTVLLSPERAERGGAGDNQPWGL